jgi:hypothetical protein
MKVLVACEYSGKVRDAFKAKGHDAWSCDLLWLKNLENLVPSKVVPGRKTRIHYMSPSKDRWKLRSETYSGIAKAMADQWG